MYTTRPGLILGFHGCDKSISSKVLIGEESLKSSKNEYDWLGHGIYFWENSDSRALEFAQSQKENPKKGKYPIDNPSVLGAVINLGYCLDLLDYSNLKLLKSAYEILKTSHNSSNFPINKRNGKNRDLVLRNLDCAVIEMLHEIMRVEKKPDFDSVRGVFFEGEELYPDAGFKEKDHIQICIINPNCIKGYFLPRKLDSDYPKV